MEQENSPHVLVRTRSAGVHFGKLYSKKGTNVVLTDSTRIWRWKGANTLNELSIIGAAEDYTRISHPVEVIELTEAIEIIPCKEKAIENLSRSRWGI